MTSGRGMIMNLTIQDRLHDPLERILDERGALPVLAAALRKLLAGPQRRKTIPRDRLSAHLLRDIGLPAAPHGRPPDPWSY